MSFNSTWEIGVLLNEYADKRKSLETDSFDWEKYEQQEALEELYAQAIELTCKKGYGLVMPIDDFIKSVCSGGINDYDGTGDLLDKDGEEIDEVCCGMLFLQNAKENGACFVAWYNG
jgi:hypothetical protein